MFNSNKRGNIENFKIKNVLKILHIEDRQEINKVFSQILSSKDYDYNSITDSKKGLVLILDKEYDLIILDLTMPEFSGFELLEELKKKQPEKIKKIVILTAEDLNPEQKRGLLSLGVISIEEKPISIQKLLSRIESIQTALV